MPARLPIGRTLLGLSAFAGGVVMLVWHDPSDWAEFAPLLNVHDGPIALIATAVAQMIGGAALLSPRTARAGAAIVGAIEFVFAILWVPVIVAAPLSYVGWGDFFEPFSVATGAAIVYARCGTRWTPATIARIGRPLMGACSVSFALFQAFFLANTAVLVPAWLPPGQSFWALATTVAFVLAAIALLTNRMALLAARLLTAMIVSFGIIIWLPILIRAPTLTNWSETVLNFAIAAAAWIVADLLALSTPGTP